MSLFSDLYTPTRTFLGDISETPSYSNAQLDMGLAAALMLDDGDFEEGALQGSDRTITPDVTAKADKARLSIQAAICLLSPQSGAFSYRTKVLSVTRENARHAHLGWLLEQLRKVREGEFVVASETEWDQFLRGSAEAVSLLSRFPT